MISRHSIRPPHFQSSRKGSCTILGNPWTRPASKRNASLLLFNIGSIRLAPNGALNPSRWICRLRPQDWFTSISRSKNISMRRAASTIFFSLWFNRPRKLKAPSERYKSLQKSLNRWVKWVSTQNSRSHHQSNLHISPKLCKVLFPYWKICLLCW